MSPRCLFLTTALLLCLTTAHAQGKARRLIYTSDHDKTMSIWVHDFKTNKSEAVLTNPDKTYVAVAASPAGRYLALYCKKDDDSLKLYDLKTRSFPKDQPFGPDAAGVAFLSETRLLIREDLREAAEGQAKLRLVSVDLNGGNRKQHYESKFVAWDDVPLKLSPDRRFAIFFENGPNRALRLFDLKNNKAHPFPKGITFLTWKPDSHDFCVFDKSQKRARLGKVEDSGAPTLTKDLAEGSLMRLWPIPKGPAVNIRFGEGRSFPATIGDGDKATPLSGVHPKLLAMRLFAYDKASKRLVWTKLNDDRSVELVSAIFKDGKLTNQQTIQKSTRRLVGLPFFTD